MQSNRLVRLLQTILKIRTRPHQTREQCLSSLSIAKSQFYRDLQLLNDLGLPVKYSKHQKAFFIKEEPRFSIPDLSLSNIMALILSARQQIMTAREDFSVAYSTYAALWHIIGTLPSKTRKQLTRLLDKLVLKDGFGCNKAILDALQEAIQNQSRILIDYQREDDNVLCRYTADPERLYFKHSHLFLNAFTPESKKTETFQVSLIKQVIKTPFLIPR